MSGRIRSIKPEILSDRKAAKLSHAAWRLWVSCWVQADDEGRLPADPDQLRARVFWGCAADIMLCLTELQDARLIEPYTVNGDIYIAIPNFRKHQKINRPSGAKYPAPEGPHSFLTEDSVRAHGGVTDDSQRDRDRDRDHDLDRNTTLSSQATTADTKSPNSPNVRQATAAVIGAFNKAFSRDLSPTGWEDAVRRVLAKGYTEAQMRGVVWWAAREWSEDSEKRRELTPKTLLKLQSSQGYRTFHEYLSCAGERWRDEHAGQVPPWEPKPVQQRLEAVS